MDKAFILLIIKEKVNSMRDIKFRVWNTYNMSMRYIPSIYCRMYEYESLPLMQYTGLKDKHGKEIYEGDILKSHEHIGTVVYSQDSFKIKNRNGYK